jgi:hypothetical protein
LHVVVKLFTELGNVMLLRPENQFVQLSFSLNETLHVIARGGVRVLWFTHPLHETLHQEVLRESRSLWVSAARGYEN